MATSTLVPNQDAAGPVIAIVFFVLLFLSGSAVSAAARVGARQDLRHSPIRHLITATFATFDNQPGVTGWAWKDLLAMAIWGVAAVVVAVRRWQWAPRRP